MNRASQHSAAQLDTQGQGSRVRHLDGLRGVAVVLVLLAHWLAGAYPTHVSAIPGLPIRISGGFTGVQLFFVLSGYLITRGLLASIEAGEQKRLRRFYLRRVLRLYPALVAATAVYLPVGYAVGEPFGALAICVVRVLTYTSNLGQLVWSDWRYWEWLDHTWSLSLEEQFYLLWPPILGLLVKAGRRGRMLGALAIALAATLARMHPPFMEASYVLIRWDALMLGAMTAMTNWRMPKAFAMLGTGLFVVASVIQIDPGRNISYAATAILAVCALHASKDIKALEDWRLVYLGKTSYSLYLIHPLFMRIGLHPVLSIVCSLAAAHLLAKYVEAPFIDLSKRVAQHARHSDAAAEKHNASTREGQP